MTNHYGSRKQCRGDAGSTGQIAQAIRAQVRRRRHVARALRPAGAAAARAARLNLTSTQMMVLLQLLEFWWTADGSSHPSIRTIAERINLSTKQTQRTVDALVEKGMIAKTNRRLANGGKTSNRYTFDGLIKKLQAIEKDFEKARKSKLAAAKPGGLLANAD